VDFDAPQSFGGQNLQYMSKTSKVKRCAWAGTHPLYVAYHDREWGVPQHNSRKLFEFLILEGAQAGLSWLTILKKRQNYRRAFDRFDPVRIANYKAADIKRLMSDAGIVRNRLKIAATIDNARAYPEIKREFGSFDKYIWSFVEGKPIVNRFKTMRQLPAKTELSERMSKDLKRRGFRFVGSTICYAFMQAVGMVNDHTTDCFRHKQITGR
jgi:DNA-3-methyladenine glycosylase I